jgi:hypothetical protein
MDEVPTAANSACNSLASCLACSRFTVHTGPRHPAVHGHSPQHAGSYKIRAFLRDQTEHPERQSCLTVLGVRVDQRRW